MPILFAREFLDDLIEAQDSKLLRRVLSHTVAEDGTFKADKQDHRYKGIKDAWIRYVSQGGAAYRVIYIRESQNVFLYRVGPHKIEDQLSAPSAFEGAVPIGSPIVVPEASGKDQRVGFLLKTKEALYLNGFLKSMYHFRHKEVYIVSPFLDLALFESRHHFGRFIDKAVEDDTHVVLITAPPKDEDLPAFKKLEERGLEVFFMPHLHAKLYLFDIDPYARNIYQEGFESIAILGSSNFTFPGTGFDDAATNEELCCALPTGLLEEIRTYVTRLAMQSDDCQGYTIKRKRGWKL